MLRNSKLTLRTSDNREESVAHGLDTALCINECSADGSACSLSLHTANQCKRQKSEELFTLTTSFCNGSKLLALSRMKLWWMSPWWGDTQHLHQLPPETQCLLVEYRSSGTVACFLPLVDSHCRCSFVGSSRNEVMLQAETGNSRCAINSMKHAVCVALAHDAYASVHCALSLARDSLASFRLRQEKEAPEHLWRFGWCTWDAYYREIDYDGLRAGIDTLAHGGCPPRFVILDDGWQNTCADWPIRCLPGVRSASDEQQASKQKHGRSWHAYTSSVASSGDMTPLMDAYDAAETQQVPRATASKIAQQENAAQRESDWLLHDHRHPSSEEHHSIEPGCIERFYWQEIHTLKTHTHLYRFCLFLLMLLRPLLHIVFSMYAAQSHRLRTVVENRKFHKLADVVDEMKASRGVELFYVWHTLLGYWAGIHPREPAMRKYNAKVRYPRHYRGVLQTEASMAWDPVTTAGIGLVAQDKLVDFYADLHGFLRTSGVDGVKVDGQALAGTLGPAWNTHGPNVASTVHAAMESSVENNFGGGKRCINCMCHANDNFLNFATTSAARVSEDYFPKDQASHTAHIVNVAYVSLLLGQIVQPDWDMFQTVAEGAEMHAAARAIGGCPMYISDTPGYHNFDILRSVVLPNGQTLTPATPAQVTNECIFTDVTSDRQTLLRVANQNTCSSVLALFNVQGACWNSDRREFVQHDLDPPVLQGSATPAECIHKSSSSSGTGRFAMYAFKSRVFALVHSVEEAALPTLLARGEFEIVTVAPVLQCTNDESEHLDTDGTAQAGGACAELAVLGLQNMMNTGGAVQSLSTHKEGARITLVPGSTGSLAVYCSELVHDAYVDGQKVQVQQRESDGIVHVPVQHTISQTDKQAGEAVSVALRL